MTEISQKKQRGHIGKMDDTDDGDTGNNNISKLYSNAHKTLFFGVFLWGLDDMRRSSCVCVSVCNMHE